MCRQRGQVLHVLHTHGHNLQYMSCTTMRGSCDSTSQSLPPEAWHLPGWLYDGRIDEFRARDQAAQPGCDAPWLRRGIKPERGQHLLLQVQPKHI